MFRKTKATEALENSDEKELEITRDSEKMPQPAVLEKAPSCPQNLRYNDGELSPKTIKQLVGDNYTVGRPTSSAIGIRNTVKSAQNDNAEPARYEGWKVHISIDKRDICEASKVVLKTIGESEYEPDEFKIATSDKIEAAEGKIITIYFIDDNKINHQALNQLLQTIEDSLIRRQISPGPSISLDKQITDSRYLFYRCGFQLIVSWEDGNSGKSFIIPKEKILPISDGTTGRKDIDPTETVKIANYTQTDVHNPLRYEDSFRLGDIKIGKKLSSPSVISRVKRNIPQTSRDQKIIDATERLLAKKKVSDFSKNFQNFWDLLDEQQTIYTLEYLISRCPEKKIKDYLEEFKCTFCAEELKKLADKKEIIQDIHKLPASEYAMLEKMFNILKKDMENKKREIDTQRKKVRSEQEIDDCQSKLTTYTEYFTIIEIIDAAFKKPSLEELAVQGKKVREAASASNGERDEKDEREVGAIGSESERNSSNEPKAVADQGYGHEKMQKLLHYYLDEKNDLIILDGIDAFQYGGQTLQENLRQQIEQIAIRLSIGDTLTQSMIMPLNLGNLHWVGLYIHFLPDNPLTPTITYFDPLGFENHDIAIQVRDILREIYLNIDENIAILPFKLQQDDYNCGPWVIAMLRSLVTTRQILPSNFDINGERQLYDTVLKDLQQEQESKNEYAHKQNRQLLEDLFPKPLTTRSLEELRPLIDEYCESITKGEMELADEKYSDLFNQLKQLPIECISPRINVLRDLQRREEITQSQEIELTLLKDALKEISNEVEPPSAPLDMSKRKLILPAHFR